MAMKLVPLVFAGAIGVIAACSTTSSTGPSYDGSCRTLASRCHGGSSALAKECHDLGHDGDDAKCGPRADECLRECPDAGGAEVHDASVTDAPAEADAAPSAECITYCACLDATCSMVANYPFADPAACHAACATYSAAERSCFHAFCADAADGGSKAHACDHATGKLGTAECP